MVDANKLKQIINNFNQRKIEVQYFTAGLDFKTYLKDIIPEGSIVGIGNSKTLKTMQISETLSHQGFKVLDKTLARNKEESDVLKKKSLLADWYLTGSNAITVDGQIVNIDHSGNRVAAMLYGPDNVIVVVGVNKIEQTLNQAIDRVRNIAAPLNAKRAGFNPPCVKLNKCIDCTSHDRVCNYLVVIEGQSKPGRLKLCIIEQELGF